MTDAAHADALHDGPHALDENGFCGLCDLARLRADNAAGFPAGHPAYPLEVAAHRYVAARIRLEGTDGANLTAAAVDLDAAWHDLHTAAGVVSEQCDGP